MGPYRFRNVPTYIFGDDFNVTSYPFLGGLIGSDILRRFNIYLDYDRRTIFLYPNSHYRDPFDYSYTGLGIYIVDKTIRVGDVMKNSPAEKAGFKIDDVIVAVNNNFSNNIQTYKTLFQTINDKVKVVVRRSTGLVVINMKIKSIF